MKLDWLLDLLPTGSATPAAEGVAPGEASEAVVHGRKEAIVDEPPHPPHLPHRQSDGVADHADALADLAERLAERAAIMELDGGLSRSEAEWRAARDYEPSIPGQTQRCIGYAPPADDPDQRARRERWPEMVEWQRKLLEG